MISKSDQRIEIKHYSTLPNWDRFVQAHPRGSIYHTTHMIECEAETKLHAPFAYGAVDSDGELCGLLVAVCISQFASLPKQFCSRSIMYAEPICVDNELGNKAVQSLVAMHDSYMSTRALFSEVRPNHETAFSLPLTDCGYERIGYLNYELELTGTESQLFSKVGQKVRNNVRSALRHGVTVEEIDLAANIDSVYKLLLASYARSKTPIVDWSHFEAASRSFPKDQLKVLIARRGSEDLATGCFLRFKNRVICWYAGTRRIPSVPAMSLIFWEAIRLHAAQGCTLFDFAGAGWQNESYGPGRFKQKFGGVQTNYGRFRKVYAPWMMSAAQSVFRNFKHYIAPKESV